MSDRADAHIHLFADGYQGQSFTHRAGVHIEEPRCFDSLAQQHGVKAALVVGYAGEAWCEENNTFLTAVRTDWPWLYPTAFIEPQRGLSRATLDILAEGGFVGLSFYIFSDADQAALLALPEEVWNWLVRQRWVLSVNSTGERWRAWGTILQQFPDLRVLVSHLGLPPRVATPPAREEARRTMAPVLALADYPGARIKLSGLYALTDPGHDYPHQAAWPHIHAALDAYGPERMLWASDFSPCLDWLTYPQTFGVIEHLPFLAQRDRQAIEGGNLLALLGEVRGV